MNLLFDSANTPIDCRFRHVQALLYFYNGHSLHPQIKNIQFIRRKIAYLPEILTFRLRELRLNIHRLALSRVPLLLPLRRLRTVTFAIIIDTSSIITLDVIGVTAAIAVDNHCIKLAPLIDMINVCPCKSED